MTEKKVIETRLAQEKAPNPIRRCIMCGRELRSDQENCCSEECIKLSLKKTTSKKKSKNGLTQTSTTEKENANNKKHVFWLTGDGAVRREHNIDLMKDLILEGVSFAEISRLAIKKFRSKTISEYYDIASEEIEFEKGDTPHE